MPDPAPASGPNPDAGSPSAWLYWNCPRCHTALVGKRTELGRRHVCAGCGLATTVGGVPPTATTPTAASPDHPSGAPAAMPPNPAPRAERPQRAAAQPPAATDTPVPAAIHLPPPAPLDLVLDRAAAERRAAADAAADALRPIYATGPQSGAAATAGRATGRSRNAAARPSPARASRAAPIPAVRPGFAILVFGLLTLVLIGGWLVLRDRQTPQIETTRPAPIAPPAANPPTPPTAELPTAPTLPPALPTTPTPPAITPASAPAAGATDLKPEEVYARAESAVVVITCYKLDPERQVAIGSGFIVADEKVIVTNAHVVENADLLEIKTRNGTTARLAHTLAIDSHRDVAILPLPAALVRQPGLKLNATLPKIGQTVFALGAPHGLDYTFTRGLVSQVRTAVTNYHTLIQTDASISPGSSGGPLLDSQCQVVGITTLASHAAKDANNLNFAVAAAEVQKVLDTRGDPKPLFDR